MSGIWLATAAAATATNQTAIIQISDRHIVNSLPAGFASFTLDFHPSSQGSVWGANASILEIDLASPGLLGVVTALAPAVLRLGGSEAGENVTYVGFPGFDAPCPSGYYYCLTRPRWAAILAFAARTGVRLMLDLNLIGPGTADDWPAALSQIDALFSYTAQQPPRLRPFAFELGNENQNILHPAEAAARVAAVGALLASRWPDEGQRPLLVGPSVHIQPDWIVDFVLALPAPLPLDVFTYHMYEGYGKAPRIAAQVPTVAFLDEARGLVDTAVGAVRYSGAGAAAARRRPPLTSRRGPLTLYL